MMKNISHLIIKDILMIKFWIMASWVLIFVEAVDLLSSIRVTPYADYLYWLPAILAGFRLIQSDHPGDERTFLACRPIESWRLVIAKCFVLLIILPIPRLLVDVGQYLYHPHSMETLGHICLHSLERSRYFGAFLVPALLTRSRGIALGLLIGFLSAYGFFLEFLLKNHPMALTTAELPNPHMGIPLIMQVGLVVALFAGYRYRRAAPIRTILTCSFVVGTALALYVPIWYYPTFGINQAMKDPTHEAFLQQALSLETGPGEIRFERFSRSGEKVVIRKIWQEVKASDLPPNTILFQERYRARAHFANGEQITTKRVLATDQVVSFMAGPISSGEWDTVLGEPPPPSGLLELYRWADHSNPQPIRVEGTATFQLQTIKHIQSVPMRAGERIRFEGREWVLTEPKMDNEFLKLELIANSPRFSYTTKQLLMLTIPSARQAKPIAVLRNVGEQTISLLIRPNPEEELPTVRQYLEEGQISLFARAIVGRTAWSFDTDTGDFPLVGDFLHKPDGVIEAIVTDTNGNPIEGAELDYQYAQSPEGKKTRGTLITDKTGKATIPLGYDHNLRITAEHHTGRHYLRCSWPSDKPVFFRLAPTGTLNGRVSDGETPVENFRVWYDWKPDDPIFFDSFIKPLASSTASTTSYYGEGRFQITEIPAESPIHLYIDVPERPIYRMEVHPEESGAQQNLALNIPSSGKKLSGRLTDMDGTPLAKGRLTVVPTIMAKRLNLSWHNFETTGAFSREFTTDPHGRFTIQTHDWSDTTLFIQAPGHELLVLQNWDGLCSDADCIREIRLQPEAVVKVRVAPNFFDSLEYVVVIRQGDYKLRRFPTVLDKETTTIIARSLPSGTYAFLFDTKEGQTRTVPGTTKNLEVQLEPGQHLNLQLEGGSPPQSKKGD